jgi:predicted esterase
MLAERFLAQLQPLADGDTLIIAPEALSRFYLETARDGRHANEVGASWLTREDREHEIADAVAYLDDLLREVSRPLTRGFQVGVLGFSQGGAIAARWVARGAALPERLVLWGLEPPGDALPGIAARLAGRELILVAGDADPLVPPGGIEAQARQLTEAGVLARAERFAGGHRVPPEALRRILGG